MPIVIDEASHAALLANPKATIVVDLESLSVTWPAGGEARFTIEPFARHCLITGVDDLGFLLAQAPTIAAYEELHSKS